MAITVNSPIATAPTATQGQVWTYLKKKGADNKLMSLVPFYYFYGQLIGINPVFSILQTGLETCWLTYDYCIITPDMKNTAGIKNSDEEIAKYFEQHPEQKSIGSDHIKECHHTFNRWSESVTAQIDHVGLYAGLPGFPSKHTYDPRHFDWCYGIGKTINDFCIHYSTDEYSKKIVNCLNEVSATKDEGVSFVSDAEITKDVSSMIQEVCTFYGITLTTTNPKPIYYVRKTFKDTASQKGAFEIFDNAKKCAKENGYRVYDTAGNCVYDSTCDYEARFNAFYGGYLKLLNHRETLQKGLNEAVSSLSKALEETKDL